MIAATAPALRGYQQDAHDAILDALAEQRSTLLVMPTGTGKTRVIASVAESWKAAHRGRGRVLAVAHREEIVRQLEGALAGVGLRVGVEMGEDRASMGDLYGSLDAVAASVQSMARRLARYQPDDFSLVIVDEAHHHVGGSMYSSLADYFAGAKVLGVTATPDRFDKRGLGGSYDGVAYTYEIRDAIAAGHLCKLRQKLVQVDGLDFSKVRTIAGDLNEGDLAKVMNEDGALHGIAEPIVRLAEKRPTLVFAVTVEHAHLLAAVLNMYAGEGSARAMDGTTDREIRRDTLRDFRAGAFQFLVNCALFTEGTDLPFVACVAVGRPTGSRALYVQMVGRGLRPKDGGGDCLVLDFAGNAGRHKLITAPQILGVDVGPEVAMRAAKLAEDGADVGEALDMIAAQDRMAELKRRAVQVRANVRVTDIDPFAVFGLERHDGRSTIGPTPGQAATLAKMGVPEKEIAGMDRRQAHELLDALIAGLRAGAATFKQRRFLMSRGLRSDVTFAEARAAMDAIASNNWRVPDEIAQRLAVAT